MSISIATATYKTDVKLPYGSLGQAIKWCRKNCNDEWCFHEHQSTANEFTPTYTFYFKDERDYITFKLWI